MKGTAQRIKVTRERVARLYMGDKGFLSSMKYPSLQRGDLWSGGKAKWKQLFQIQVVTVFANLGFYSLHITIYCTSSSLASSV